MVLSISLQAQETFPTNGAPDNSTGKYAFTNATIFKSYNQKIDNATLVIEDGKIVAIGTNITAPAGAVVKDMEGMTIYPSFVEAYSNYGMPEMKRGESGWGGKPQPLSNKEGAYGWNQAIKPEWNAADHFTIDKKGTKEMRKLGYGTAMVHSMDGISRGTGAVVTLGDDVEQKQLLKTNAAHVLSFEKGISTQNYPNSHMGAISLIRQTYMDGQWYGSSGKNIERNLTLEAWNNVQNLPQVFVTRDRLEVLRAAKIGAEFGKKYLIKGSGDEYQRINEIKAVTQSLIIPVNFPKAYDVEDPYEAQVAELQDMKHWELAPSNPSRLVAAGFNVAMTTSGLKKKDSFHGMLRKAILAGLSESEALKALTITPAKMIGADAWVGSLETGKLANFIVASGNIFKKKTKIYQNWVQGAMHTVSTQPGESIAGKYDLRVFRQVYNMEVTEKAGKPSAKIIFNDTTSSKVNLKYNKGQLTLSFVPDGQEDGYRLAGTKNGKNWSGRGQGSNGKWLSWSATFKGEVEEKESKKEEKKKRPNQDNETNTELAQVTFPFLPYGWTEKPKAETVLIKGATVWTNESEGILENADVIISNGKISAVGKDLSVPRGGIIIDGKGKHVTSGVIDEHSHIAISKGVNEGTQASSAEVSIGHVVNSEDINIYRQLAGGVVASQLLHGSANPIGGQSGIIKLRWGLNPEEMKIKGADGFIKFALGENVKQANWGDNNQSRFPQTRMGVEQVFVDHFTRAQEYAALKKSGQSFRKDLELEALQEILESKRFISCHSYRQSEVNMLMKVAEQFDFRVNTFTHILEGYKVADIMAEHGVGGSTFSDWWAYKYEVDEATPYNGSIMHEQGVTVAFNSDDAEMARRLNQEAAKAVKYGGVSEEDAWKFVTLNPAKLLHLDDHMGSLKSGKDADVVLWSHNPLSVYAMAEKTWVDGVRYFDRDKDKLIQAEIEKERARLIKKMLKEKSGGSDTQEVKKKWPRHYSCGTLEHMEETTGHKH